MEKKEVNKKADKKDDKKLEKTNKKAEVKDAKKEIKTNTKKENTNPEVKIPEARATLRYERISSSKVTIVAKLIKGMDAQDALNTLKFTNKAGADILYKLLQSAMANAVNNHYMDETKLYVHEVYANQGPTLKRFIAKAKGSGARILKRTSHITIVLRERN